MSSFLTADTAYSGPAGDKTNPDGLGHWHAFVRLPLHCALLRCNVQRRGRYDLHGGDGYLSGQVLHEGICTERFARGTKAHTRAHTWQNCLLGA